MKRVFAPLCMLFALALLTGCASSKKGALGGSYTAVNPPVESGEMVILALDFDCDKVTMRSGDVAQTVNYKIDGETFTLITKYGSFDYDYLQKEDGTIVIDGVDYAKD